MDVEEDIAVPWYIRFGKTIVDWAIALGLTVLGFWLISMWRTPNLPDQAPDWTLQTIEGKTVSLSDYKGKKVVLNFWATWCGPCRMEIPEFRKFVDEHPDIPVLGIAVDGGKPELSAFAKKNAMNYPVLLGSKQVSMDYSVSSLPMTVIIDETGQIQDVHVGAMLGKQLEWAVGE